VLGPAFVAEIVKITLLPIEGEALFTVFTTCKSVIGFGVGVTVDVLFPGVGSFSLPVIVAVFP